MNRILPALEEISDGSDLLVRMNLIDGVLSDVSA